MPVVTKKQRRTTPNQELKDRLVAEWRNEAAPNPRPYIVQEENDQGHVVHVYVVWDEWGDLDQQQRSEVITEAYWEVFDVQGLALTVAMGLTSEEAKRMGIPTS
jgi:hypothetical protein